MEDTLEMHGEAASGKEARRMRDTSAWPARWRRADNGGVLAFHGGPHASVLATISVAEECRGSRDAGLRRA